MAFQYSFSIAKRALYLVDKEPGGEEEPNAQ